MGTTTSSPQTTDDVNAIIAGMGRAPDALQPGYQPPMPVALQPSPQGGSGTVTPTVQLAGPPVPNQPPSSQPPPDANYTVSPVRPGDPGYQSPQQPPPQPPVALNRPPAFQLGHQPGPWPAAYPDSPRYEPSQAPPLPGETPQETADLNRHLGHETGNRGNIINDWAARDPSRYYNNGQTCSGYWQITNSTWADGAKRAGVDTRQYPTAMSAPYQVQRQVALALYRAYGNQPWTPQPGAGEHGDRAVLRPQLPVPPDARDSQDWGHPPPRNFGPGPSGQQSGQPLGPFGQANFMQPGQSGFTRVFNAIAPLLLGIGSLALRLPLSTAITAYGAMARAQDNGQREAFQQAHTLLHDNIDAANAQQTQESRAASDAFTEYANNPQGLQQELARIALQYNDPTMYRMAERGDLNGIHQLQTKRDQYNQDLSKLNRAVQDQQDRQAQDAAVAAMDRKYQQEHPDATPDDLAIAHNQHIGEASRAGTKTDTSDAEEAAIYNVLGPDKQPTGQQVRAGKQGGLFDVGTKQPVQLKPGETIAPETRGTAGGGLEASKSYDVVDKDGKVVRTVLARERKDQPGLLDAQTGEPIQLEPGQSFQPHVRPSPTADNLETSKPYDIVDKDGHVVQPNVMLREARNKAGYVHSEDGSPLVLEPGQRVKEITPTTSGGGRAGAQVLRQLVGGREVLSDLQNVVRLPIGTTIGPLGTSHPGPTIVDALTGDLARKLTDQDSQLMQASMASMSRELSILMSPVYGGNWAAQQIDPLIPKSGDTIKTTVFKLARLAQSADNALEAASKSPILSNEEQAYAQELRRQIKESIPWSTAEAMDFVYRGHPKESFGDYVKRQGVSGDQGGSDTPKPPTGLPSGSQWSPSRRQWRDPSGKLYDETGKPL